MSNESRLRRLEAVPKIIVPHAASRLEVPNIIDFILRPDFLGVERLYPRQATLLKVMFLEAELLTPYDLTVLAEWVDDYSLIVDEDGTTRYDGSRGIVPDWEQRMAKSRAAGRRWFAETVAVTGRRGSKGFTASVSSAYVVWNLLALDDPRAYFGVTRRKRLELMVLAGQADQARTNQWQDLVDVIRDAPCFERFIADVSSDTLRLFVPAQLAEGSRPKPGDAAIRITAKPATTLAGRGPAAFGLLFDEMAHAQASGANRSAEETFTAATPALAQFPEFSFLWEGSSPWQQTGRFYQNYLAGLRVDPETYEAINYDTLVFQFPSPELYRDFERTGPGGLLIYPGGPTFPGITRPIYAYDDKARRDEQANPDTYRVEFGAQWATTQDAYLHEDDVAAMFGPWPDEPLAIQTHGRLGTVYISHCDPSVSGANFAVVIAHREGPDDQGAHHMVVDYIHVWQPADFPGHKIRYGIVEDHLKELIRHFPLKRLSFDPFNSAGIIERLQEYTARTPGLPRRTLIDLVKPTAPRNRMLAETFKTALGLRLVHAPFHRLAQQELLFLQEFANGRVDHPTGGPVQTSDIADCLFELAYQLLGDNAGYGTNETLSNLRLHASQPGGLFIPDRESAHEALGQFGRDRALRARAIRNDPGQARARGWR